MGACTLSARSLVPGPCACESAPLTEAGTLLEACPHHQRSTCVSAWQH